MENKKGTIKVKSIEYEGSDILVLDTDHGIIRAKVINPLKK
jgi:hypothetical protein